MKFNFFIAIVIVKTNRTQNRVSVVVFQILKFVSLIWEEKEHQLKTFHYAFILFPMNMNSLALKHWKLDAFAPTNI